MDLMAGIGAVTQAIGIAKTLKQVEQAYDEATYKVKIADLIDALTDAKLALAEAKESMSAKEAEIRNLQAAFAKLGELIEADGDYKYFVDENGNPRGYPICPKCEHSGSIVQLKQAGKAAQARCPVCATTFDPVVSHLPTGETGIQAESRRITEGYERLNNAMLRANGIHR